MVVDDRCSDIPDVVVVGSDADVDDMANSAVLCVSQSSIQVFLCPRPSKQANGDLRVSDRGMKFRGGDVGVRYRMKQRAELRSSREGHLVLEDTLLDTDGIEGN